MLRASHQTREKNAVNLAHERSGVNIKSTAALTGRQSAEVWRCLQWPVLQKQLRAHVRNQTLLVSDVRFISQLALKSIDIAAGI